jgi:DNA ligase (NAD+)
MDRKDELLKLLYNARKAYYKGDKTMSDTEFDNLEEELRRIDSNNDYFKKIGVEEVASRFKSKIHTIPMLSMNKCHTEEEFIDWYNKSISKLPIGYNKLLSVKPKIDGNSGDLEYVNGELKVASRRGDGKIGIEVPNVLNYSDIKKEIPIDFTGNIRGEFYIPKYYIKKGIIDKNEPLRNKCAGILNRLENNDKESLLIHFVAYDIVPYFDIDSDNTVESMLKEAELAHTPFIYFEKPTQVVDYYKKYMAKIRDEWDYETDGLVISFSDMKTKAYLDNLRVVDHHHHYQIAFKSKAVGKTTKLVDIEWNVSRSGRIVPVGIIIPVKIDNVIVSRVTLNNISYIRVNDIKINDTIEVIRSGDVIPKFINRKHNLDSKEIILNKCPSCNSIVELDENKTDFICKNDRCAGQKINNIIHWFERTGIENVGESLIEKIVKEGKIEEIYQIYEMGDNFLYFVGNIGNIDIKTDKMKRFWYTFDKSRRQTEQQIIGNYGIPRFGFRLLEKFHINTLGDLIKYKDPKYMRGDYKNEENLCVWLNSEDNLLNLVKLLDILKPFMSKSVESKGKKRTFCITGTFTEKRNDIIAKVCENSDLKYSNTVNKDLTMLFIGKESEKSSKIKTATKFGVKTCYFNDGVFDYNALKLI